MKKGKGMQIIPVGNGYIVRLDSPRDYSVSSDGYTHVFQRENELANFIRTYYEEAQHDSDDK